MTEARLSNWVVSAASGSLLLAATAFLLLFGGPSALRSSFGVGSVLLLTGYLASVVAVSTLPGKSRGRRRASWAFSLAFHAGIPVFAVLYSGLGPAVLVFLAPEIAGSIFSALGLVAAFKSNGVAHAV